MKICVAQSRAIKGEIVRNIANHKTLIELAVSQGAELVIFPELSITGYEPELAKELATNQEDSRFEEFQKIADSKNITIGVGVPTKTMGGICISMVVFQADKPRQTYSKKYLHADKEAFFIRGENTLSLTVDNTNIALAICYEISVEEHAEEAFKGGAAIYIASVVKTVKGVEKAIKRLGEIAHKYSMTVLMSNSVGESDGYKCGGKTSIWNNKGILVGELNDSKEGILIINTETQEVIEKAI